MATVKEDQTHLIALVALLISTAAFKDELRQAEINNTGITLFDIFLYATIALGLILFLHLILNYTHLFLSALKEKRKDWALILLRGSVLLILFSVPLSVGYVASSNWLNNEECGYYSETDFLGTELNEGQKQICTTPLISTVVPLAGGILVTALVVIPVVRSERKFYKLPKEAQLLSLQIAELRIMQATTGSPERINELQTLVDSLKDQYVKVMESSDKKD